MVPQSTAASTSQAVFNAQVQFHAHAQDARIARLENAFCEVATMFKRAYSHQRVGDIPEAEIDSLRSIFDGTRAAMLLPDAPFHEDLEMERIPAFQVEVLDDEVFEDSEDSEEDEEYEVGESDREFLEGGEKGIEKLFGDRAGHKNQGTLQEIIRREGVLTSEIPTPVSEEDFQRARRRLLSGRAEEPINYSGHN